MLIPSEQDFAQAVALWREWNGRINVISRKDEDNIFVHHILHSLAIAQYLELFYPSASPSAADRDLALVPQKDAVAHKTLSDSDLMESPLQRGASRHFHQTSDNQPVERHAPTDAETSFLDVGTGGGFPGIPLAMVMPGAKFTLCDSIGKKVKVAQAVSDGLGLQNVECVNARVESLPGQWDWVVSRAVTSLENFYPWVKGRFRRSILYLKGGDIDAEIAALRKKYHIPTANIRTWRIDSWLKDEYFAEKFVIEVGKNYLCTP
jgi:16S rRNA (guanine527-N7)-methyltransferase